jgi:hypothetical protein
VRLIRSGLSAVATSRAGGAQASRARPRTCGAANRKLLVLIDQNDNLMVFAVAIVDFLQAVIDSKQVYLVKKSCSV